MITTVISFGTMSADVPLDDIPVEAVNEWHHNLVHIGGGIGLIFFLAVICCAVLQYKKSKVLKKMGYDFVSTTDTEFYSTDTELDNMSEIEIDGI